MFVATGSCVVTNKNEHLISVPFFKFKMIPGNDRSDVGKEKVFHL